MWKCLVVELIYDATNVGSSPTEHPLSLVEEEYNKHHDVRNMLPMQGHALE